MTTPKYPPISRKAHLSRGYCCKNGCLYCPYDAEGKVKAAYLKEYLRLKAIKGGPETRDVP